MLSNDQKVRLHELRMRKTGRSLTEQELRESDAYIAFLEAKHAESDTDENALKSELFVEFPEDNERHYEPDVTDVSLGAANIRWGGESAAQRNAYVENRKRENGVDCFDIAVDGAEELVFVQRNGKGSLVRYWLSRTENLTARIRYNKARCAYELQIWRNVKGERWQGSKLVTHFVHRTVTTEAELTVAKYVAVYFTRFA